MQIQRLLTLTICVLLLTGGILPMLAQESELPELVIAEFPSMHPEGIEWDAANERFLTGSLAQGTLFEIADDGTVTPFIEDEALTTTVGIHIDAETGRLLVAN